MDTLTKQAVKTTIATDTASIATMEVVDNAFILLVPGAIEVTTTSATDRIFV